MSDLGQFAGKALRSRYTDADRTENAARRVLAPFLARHKKKLKMKVTDIKEEYKHVYQQTNPGEILAKLADYFKQSMDLSIVLNETSEIIRVFTKSDGLSLYIVDPSNEYIVLCPKYAAKSDRYTVRYSIEPGTTVAAYVAFVQECVVIDDILGDERFPEGVPGAGKTVKSVLCLPVLTCTEGEVIAVIELYRNVYEEPYTVEEVQMAITTAGWMGAAISQNSEKVIAMKENELNKYFMNLLQMFFSGVIPFDKFVSDIIIFAKETVGAERGSFYQMVGNVVEGMEDDIFTAVYEEGIDSSHQSYKKKTIQCFSKSSPGIAGHVARTGKSITLEDAYEDERFNKASDILGFRSRTILAVPIKSSLNVVGVLQLVNKFPFFTEKDEQMMQKFASYSLLACQYANASNDLRKTVRRYEGNKELVMIHLQPCPDDREMMSTRSILNNLQIPKNYFGFDWFIGGHEKNSVQFVLFSFIHCLGRDYFDFVALTEFVLMAKKSYRPNPYHNFVHAFTVFHCVFNIINKNQRKFTAREKAALLIATLCHDADHFGFTNTFLCMTDNWLADLYEESSLEHHHFDICMTLVEISQLFSRFSAKEYHEIRGLIESLILATDLAAHFKLRGFISNIVKTGAFDWCNDEHRITFMHVIMTCCDVSGQCKPFPVAKYVTECLYREFYNQGDEEKKYGVTPLSMMDRHQMDLIPVDQINFLNIICIPCLEILVSVLPNTEILLKMCLNVVETWKIIKGEQEENLWWPEEALCLEKKTFFEAVEGARSGETGKGKHKYNTKILA